MKKTYFKLSVAAMALTFMGCGSSGSSGPALNDGQGVLDLADYYPTSDISSKTYVNEVNGTLVGASIQTIERTDDVITYSENGNVEEVVTLSDSNITTKEGEDISTHYRNVDLGERLFSFKETSTETVDGLGEIPYSVDSECLLVEKLSEYEKGMHKYSGDILKIKCTSDLTTTIDLPVLALENATLYADYFANSDKYKDLNGTHKSYNESFLYVQKDIGLIAEIDDDCISNSLLSLVDDRLDSNSCSDTYSEYKFYVPSK